MVLLMLITLESCGAGDMYHCLCNSCLQEALAKASSCACASVEQCYGHCMGKDGFGQVKPITMCASFVLISSLRGQITSHPQLWMVCTIVQRATLCGRSQDFL